MEMKKLIVLIIFVLSLNSCSQKITDEGVVTRVELVHTELTKGSYEYKLHVGNEFNGMWRIGDVIVYTNTLYQVGDTIKISK